MPGIAKNIMTPKRINNNLYTMTNIVSDLIALLISHFILYKTNHLPYKEIADYILPSFLDVYPVFSFTIILISLWLFSLFLSGNYTHTPYKSGLQIFGPTIAASFIITIILFFTILGYQSSLLSQIYPILSLKYLMLNFSLIMILRLFHMHLHQYRIKTGKIGYHGLLIGVNNNTLQTIENYKKNISKSSYKYIGFIAAENDNIEKINPIIPYLGSFDNFQHIINNYSFDEAIISVSNEEPTQINTVITELRQKKCQIKLLTTPAEIINGTVYKQKLENYPFYVIHNG